MRVASERHGVVGLLEVQTSDSARDVVDVQVHELTAKFYNAKSDN